jgi:hypothetical protein
MARMGKEHNNKRARSPGMQEAVHEIIQARESHEHGIKRKPNQDYFLKYTIPSRFSDRSRDGMYLGLVLNSFIS